MFYGSIIVASLVSMVDAQTCQAGTYRLSGSCVQCETGKYSKFMNKTVCTLCSASLYSNVTGATSCIACEAGKVSMSDGLTACASCTPGYFMPPVTTGYTRCPFCSKGTISTGYGATACTGCIGATYQSNDGASQCYTCDIGTYNNGVTGTPSPACPPCAVGSYNTAYASSTCYKCTVSTYASATGSSACIACQSGTYATLVGAANSTRCIPCELGKYGIAASSTACISCTESKYTSQTGTTFCTVCQAGTYAANPTLAGATSSSVCVQCSMGKYSSTASASTCITCPVSTYASQTGASGCDACGLGNFVTNGTLVGATSPSICRPCSPGTFYDSVSFNLVVGACPQNCGGGRYMNESGSKIQSGYACNVCLAGKYAPWYTINAACTECGPNTFSPVDRSYQCTQCPLGTFSNGTGRTRCDRACKAGSYGTPTACMPCQNGTYSPADGASSCTACQSGTYAAGGGSTACLSCPDNLYAPDPASSRCISCNTTGAYYWAQGKCAGCGIGRFATSSIAPQCASPTWLSRIADKFYLHVYDPSYPVTSVNYAYVYTGSTMPLEAAAKDRLLLNTMQWDKVRILGKLSRLDTNRSVWLDPSDTVRRVDNRAYLPGSPLDSVGFLGSMICNDNTEQSSVRVRGDLSFTFFKFPDTNSFSVVTTPDNFSATASVTYDANSYLPGDVLRYVAVDIAVPAMRLGQCAIIKFDGELKVDPRFEVPYDRGLRDACSLYPDDPALECLGDETICGTACRKCPRGSYSTALSVTACVACDVGTYSPDLGASACLSCPAGLFSPPAATVCLNCAPGYAHRDMLGCRACGPTNQYAPYHGMTACMNCPTNTYASVPVATLVFHCRCLPGYFCQYTRPRFVAGLRHASLSQASFITAVAAAAGVAQVNVTLR